jgi:vacuolar-type H+-ATPase subunit F/Vma7
MTEVEIQHFLVVYNLAKGKAQVREFGTDYDSALAAYAEVEEDFANRETYDIVLIGADSLDTIKRTHSSYFHTEETFESLLPPGVLA